MLEKWTGEVVGTMHIYGITNTELARKMGVHEKYLSALLNCRKTPKGAEFKTRMALNAILQERSANAAAEID